MLESLIYMLAGAVKEVKSRWLVEAGVLPQGELGAALNVLHLPPPDLVPGFCFR